MPNKTALLDLLESAWGLIANVSGGNWLNQHEDWVAAAERWRTKYYTMIDGRDNKADAVAEKYRVRVRLNDNEPWGWFVKQYGERGHHHGLIESESPVFDRREAEFVADYLRLVMGREVQVEQVP